MHKPHIHKANTIDLVWALGTIKNKTKQNKTLQMFLMCIQRNHYMKLVNAHVN